MGFYLEGFLEGRGSLESWEELLKGWEEEVEGEEMKIYSCFSYSEH